MAAYFDIILNNLLLTSLNFFFLLKDNNFSLLTIDRVISSGAEKTDLLHGFSADAAEP